LLATARIATIDQSTHHARRICYSKEELDNFLNIIEEVLPIFSTTWKCVAEVHSLRYPNMGWTADRLKLKFKELHYKRTPTGDPYCPPAVIWAKCLRREIVKKMDGSDLNSKQVMVWGTTKMDDTTMTMSTPSHNSQPESKGVQQEVAAWTCQQTRDGATAKGMRRRWKS
jgi:hypothetical protein